MSPFKSELLPHVTLDLFSHEKGSCTWTEQFILQDVATRVSHNSARHIVHALPFLNGEQVDITAYKKFIGGDETLLITESSDPSLPGVLCHLTDNNSNLEVLRYFNGGVQFGNLGESLEKNLNELGIEMPQSPGEATSVLLGLLGSLEVPVEPTLFQENVMGMADWLSENYPQESHKPWPLSWLSDK